MAETWHDKAPTRNITIHRGEDIDIGGTFRREGAPWLPPEDSEAYFVAFRKAGDGGKLTLACTISDDTFSVHIEEAVCDTLELAGQTVPLSRIGE